MQPWHAPRWYPSSKGLKEKSRGDTVNYTPLPWQRGADPLGCARVLLPWLCTADEILANFKGLKSTGFIKPSVLSFLLHFIHVRAADKASLPS